MALKYCKLKNIQILVIQAIENSIKKSECISDIQCPLEIHFKNKFTQSPNSNIYLNRNYVCL